MSQQEKLIVEQKAKELFMAENMIMRDAMTERNRLLAERAELLYQRAILLQERGLLLVAMMVRGAQISYAV